MTASLKIGDKICANGGERIGEIVSVTAGIYRVAFNHGGGVITFGEFPVDRMEKVQDGPLTEKAESLSDLHSISSQEAARTIEDAAKAEKIASPHTKPQSPRVR